MQVTLNIPDGVVKSLEDLTGPDIARGAIERLSLEGYQSGKLSRYEVQQLLGFDNRWETEEWLGKHGATWQYSLQDLEHDRRVMDHLFGER